MSETPKVEFEADSDDIVITVPVRFRLTTSRTTMTASRVLSIPLREFRPDGIRKAILESEKADPQGVSPWLQMQMAQGWIPISHARPPTSGTYTFAYTNHKAEIVAERTCEYNGVVPNRGDQLPTFWRVPEESEPNPWRRPSEPRTDAMVEWAWFSGLDSIPLHIMACASATPPHREGFGPAHRWRRIIPIK